MQYPDRITESQILVITPELLDVVLDDIDRDSFFANNSFQTIYYHGKLGLDITSAKNRSTIEISFFEIGCAFRMAIVNKNVTEDYLEEISVIYSFVIKNNTIINFNRQESG